MNCDEYRQAIGADPSFDGGEAHLSQCEACRSYRDDLRSLETRIRDALALPVPELDLPELADDPAGDNVVPLRGGRTKPTFTWLAVAATVVVAAFLGFRFVGPADAPSTLPEQILAHIDNERGSLRVTDEAVSDERLANVVPASIAVMDHGAGLITYAQSCPINGNTVPHLVIQGERGPVTILLMSEETVDGTIEFEGERVHGIIVPVGNGSIAIVGPRDDLGNIEQRVVNSVTWTT